MESTDSCPDPERAQAFGQFPATRWTRVIAANGNGEDADRALNDLCAIYWYPLYAFVRRQGKGPEDAQDLTQGFFADLLRSDMLGRAREERGRLRSFLLGAMKNHMACAYRRETAQKRGGVEAPVPIDEETAERRYLQEPDAASPERVYERRWALEILGRVVESLREEYQSKKMGERFETLAPLLAGQEAPDHSKLARQLGMKAGAVRTALSRMRKRYRELLVHEIADTVSSPDLVEEELQNLIASLRSGSD